MSLEDVCSYLNSLPDQVDHLSPDDIHTFFTSFYGPTQIDTPVDKHFFNFAKTIRSLRSWIDMSGNIHLRIDRVFTLEESLSMKASQNVEAFVWALGYMTFGCGLNVSISDVDSQLKIKKEALYFLCSAFQKTHPHVRTLQSLSFDKAAKEDCHRDYMNSIATDNPSFINTEKLSKMCFHVSCPDSFFYEEHVAEMDGFYNGPSESNINSCIFTSCLKYLEDKTNLYQSSGTLKVKHGILIQNDLVTDHRVLYMLLNKVFQDLGKKSPRIDKSICACNRYIGFKLKCPWDCEMNKELLCDVHLAVLFLNGKKYSKYCNCRECIEFDAAYQACLYFVDRAVLSFQTIKQIQL